MKSTIAVSVLATILSMGVNAAMAAAIDTTATTATTTAVAGAETVPTEEFAPLRICRSFSDCGFCGFYERCCYKEYGSHPEDDGTCKCGTNGREGHCF